MIPNNILVQLSSERLPQALMAADAEDPQPNMRQREGTQVGGLH